MRGRRLWWAPPLLALPATLSFPVGAGALTARPHSQRYVWTFAVEMLRSSPDKSPYTPRSHFLPCPTGMFYLYKKVVTKTTFMRPPSGVRSRAPIQAARMQVGKVGLPCALTSPSFVNCN